MVTVCYMPSIWLDHPDWTRHAACREAPDPEIFFPAHGNIRKAPSVRLAKSYCAVCPVTAECLDDAEPEGIWGGLTAGERHTLGKSLPIVASTA